MFVYVPYFYGGVPWSSVHKRLFEFEPWLKLGFRCCISSLRFHCCSPSGVSASWTSGSRPLKGGYCHDRFPWSCTYMGSLYLGMAIVCFLPCMGMFCLFLYVYIWIMLLFKMMSFICVTLSSLSSLLYICRTVERFFVGP